MFAQQAYGQLVKVMPIEQKLVRWSGTLAERAIVFSTVPEDGTEWYDSANDTIYRVENSVWRQYNAVMVFRGVWNPEVTYGPGDVVYDRGWTMVANKTTDQRPKPQGIGSPVWVSGLGTSPSWTVTSDTVSELISGQRYTWGINGFITNVRIWVQTVSANLEYLLGTVRDPGGDDELLSLEAFSPTATGWYNFPFPHRLITSGTVLDIGSVKRDRSSSSTFNGNWNYLTPTNATVPTAGQITHANKLDNVLRVHKTDNDTNDQSTNLATLDPGDEITAGGLTWTIISITDNTTYLSIEVRPITQLSSDGVKNFVYTVYGTASISYVYIASHYSGNPNVGGIYFDSGYDPSITPDDTAYGVDIEVQEAVLSDDWDFLAYST